jgi:hypothetical protein
LVGGRKILYRFWLNLNNKKNRRGAENTEKEKREKRKEKREKRKEKSFQCKQIYSTLQVKDGRDAHPTRLFLMS